MAVSKDSAGAEKSKNKLRKRAKKREEEKAQAKDDAAVDISLSNVLTLGVSKASTKGKQKAASGPRPASAIDDEDVDADSEVDEQEKRLELKGKGRAKGVKAFEQRDLIALAFAGDNVVQVGAFFTVPATAYSLAFRIFPRLSVEKFKKTRPRKWIPQYQAGSVVSFLFTSSISYMLV